MLFGSRPGAQGPLPIQPTPRRVVCPQWPGSRSLRSQPEQRHHQRPAPGAGEAFQGADREGEGEAHRP